MRVAVWGANGRVGSRICAIATNRCHEVFAVDRHNCTTFDQVCDVVIDFSSPSCTEQVVHYCKRHLVPLVVGTTGHNEHQLALLDDLKNCVDVVVKANFSKGIDIVGNVCRQIASKTHWEVAIVETHHKNKVDCPSGTAKELAKAVGRADISSLRLGNQFGTHTILFAGIDECIEVTHRATSVDVFAIGAIEVAESIAKIDNI